MVQDTMAGRYQKQRLRQRMNQNTLGTNTIDTLSVKLRQVASMNNGERAQLFHELRAWVALDPSRLEQIKLWLNLYHVDHPSFQMLSTLLVSIGSPQAQQVMLDIMASGDAEKQKAMMLKMTFLKAPTVETEQAVSALANSLPPEERLQAKFVLGGMAHFLMASDPVRSKAIFEQFSDELSSAQNNTEIEDSLSVMGNIGLPEQTDIVNRI
ncbi:hypothetical protein P4S72_26665 [Vibrio sp. PP-XX7]